MRHGHKKIGAARRRSACLFRAAVLVVTTLAISACSSDDTRRVDMCQSVVGYLQLGADAVDFVSSEANRNDNTVRVKYRVRMRGRPGRVQWVRCRFDQGGFQSREPNLVAVETSNGPLGDGRLFVLKRWWLNEGFAAWQRDES